MSTRVAKKLRKVARQVSRKYVQVYFDEIGTWSLRERIKMAWRILFIKK